jgi:hypothetical protein
MPTPRPSYSAFGQRQDEIKELVLPLSHPALPKAFPLWDICEPSL